MEMKNPRFNSSGRLYFIGSSIRCFSSLPLLLSTLLKNLYFRGANRLLPNMVRLISSEISHVVLPMGWHSPVFYTKPNLIFLILIWWKIKVQGIIVKPFSLIFAKVKWKFKIVRVGEFGKCADTENLRDFVSCNQKCMLWKFSLSADSKLKCSVKR